MTKKDIFRKMCSRKFWLAVVGFISGLLLAFKVDAETVETISGCIMAGASVIAYIIGEGMADAANAGSVEIEKVLYDEDDEDGTEDEQ